MKARGYALPGGAAAASVATIVEHFRGLLAGEKINEEQLRQFMAAAVAIANHQPALALLGAKLNHTLLVHYRRQVDALADAQKAGG